MVGTSSKEKARLNWGHAPITGPFIPVHSLRAIARGIIWLFHVDAASRRRSMYGGLALFVA
jgi:hypothetical protein